MVLKDWNVHWQSGTKKGTVIVRNQSSGEAAYQVASKALAAISNEHKLMYLNVTVEERK